MAIFPTLEARLYVHIVHHAPNFLGMFVDFSCFYSYIFWCFLLLLVFIVFMLNVRLL